jgi:phage shock protein A
MTALELAEIVKGIAPVIKGWIASAVAQEQAQRQQHAIDLLQRCASLDTGRERDRQTVARLEADIRDLRTRLLELEATAAAQAPATHD